jgi:serine carboxypeptidase-like clade 1
VPDDEYDFLVTQCNASHPSSRAAGSWVSVSAPLKAGSVGVAHGSSQSMTRVVATKPRRTPLAAAASTTTANCTAALRRYLISSSKGVSQNWDHSFINELSLFSPRAQFRFDIPGTLNYRTARWMMDPNVRKALHVDAAPAKAWPGPAEGWSYTSSYAACNDDAKPGTKSMVDFYRELAPVLPGKIVVYNGDTDPCVSYEGTRTAIEKVGFPVAQPYRPWFFNFTAAETGVLEKKDLLFGPSLSLQAGGAQYGGEIVDYENGLSFATVHGSGHMVPTFRPRAALKLIEHVVRNTSFSPEVPDDASLVSMSSAQFDKFLDSWVDQAESAAFIVSPV